MVRSSSSFVLALTFSNSVKGLPQTQISKISVVNYSYLHFALKIIDTSSSDSAAVISNDLTKERL